MQLLLKRDDLIHPDISGNKWRKLKHNLAEAHRLGHTTLLTFGGAFSNHIAATAVGAQLFGFKAIGIIRGEAHYQSNPTLSFAKSHGMLLDFVSREAYAAKDDPQFIEMLVAKYGAIYVIPEGGANELGVLGCSEIMDELPESVDAIATAIGTGTTFLGLLKNSKPHQQTLGIAVLKGFEAFELSVRHDLDEFDGKILHTYHFGGYAKYTAELIQFINDFKGHTGIALDPIYTGKMMYGVFDLITSGYFAKGTTVVALHTGGLQGIAGFNERHGQLVL